MLTRSNQIITDVINGLVGCQDALEAMLDTAEQGITREQYVSMHVAEAQTAAGEAWDLALFKLRKHGTVRKALREVGRRLESYRGIVAADTK